MQTRVGVLLSAVAFSGGACRQAAVTSNPLVGVWSVVEMLEQMPNGQLRAFQPQPGQFIFTASRYSAVWVPQAEARPVSAKRWRPTEAEKAAAFGSVVANSGTYEIAGTRITIHPLVAKMPDFTGGQLTYAFRLDGEDLVLEAVGERSADGIQPPNYDASRERLRLRRIR